MQWYSCENNILFQDKMRFYKGTDQYVVAVTAREEVSLLLLLGWTGFLDTEKSLKKHGLE